MTLYGQFSCDMPVELLKKGVGWQDRAVYAEAALYCRKELTDGVIDRTLLAMWMIDLEPTARAAALDRMVARRALRRHRLGWQFPPHVWSQWGVMRADVEAKREAEKLRKQEYRAELSQRDMNGTPADARVTATSRPKQPEPEPEPEPEPITTSSSENVLQMPPRQPVDDDDFARTVDLIADARCTGRNARNPRAYRAVVRGEAVRLDGELVRRLLGDGTPPEQVALFVLGHGTASAAERAAVAVAWCGPDCSTCDGTAWIDTGAGLAPCPDRHLPSEAL